MKARWKGPFIHYARPVEGLRVLRSLMLGMKKISLQKYIQNIKQPTCGKFTQNGQVYYFSLMYSNLWRIAAY